MKVWTPDQLLARTLIGGSRVTASSGPRLQLPFYDSTIGNAPQAECTDEVTEVIRLNKAATEPCSKIWVVKDSENSEQRVAQPKEH